MDKGLLFEVLEGIAAAAVVVKVQPVVMGVVAEDTSFCWLRVMVHFVGSKHLAERAIVKGMHTWAFVEPAVQVLVQDKHFSTSVAAVCTADVEDAQDEQPDVPRGQTEVVVAEMVLLDDWTAYWREEDDKDSFQGIQLAPDPDHLDTWVQAAHRTASLAVERNQTVVLEAQRQPCS